MTLRPAARLAWALVLATAAGVRAQGVAPVTEDQARLEQAAFAQAGALLERFGDTFYAVGLYVGRDGEVAGVTARAWPSLDAAPAEWTDSLVAGMVDYRPLMRSVGYLVDEWRPVDAAGEARTFAIFHFEAPDGTCSEVRWRFGWDADERTVWTPMETMPCQRRVWR